MSTDKKDGLASEDKTVVRIEPPVSPNNTNQQAVAPLKAAESLVGTVVGGHFQLIRELGAGGMSTVFEATDLKLHRQVAIKLLAPKLQKNPESLSRFDVEAKATGRLNHKNIVKVFECGVHQDRPFLIMEFLDGKSLADLLQEKRPLSIPDTLTIILQVCNALEEAHLHKVVHRDLKPTNIMLVGNDIENLRLVDFGIARIISDTAGQALTKTGDVFGSPLYMSPEQCSGKHVDKRSDIYSLGCIIYECLTGQPPHVGDNSIATITKHLNDQPLSLKEATLGGNFPQELESIVARMLEKKPDNRYRCVEELKFELERFAAHRPANDSPWADGALPPGADFFNDLRVAQMRGLQKLDLSMYQDREEETRLAKSGTFPLSIVVIAILAAVLFCAAWQKSVSDRSRKDMGATATQPEKASEEQFEHNSEKEQQAAEEEVQKAYTRGKAALKETLKETPNALYLNCAGLKCSPSGWALLKGFHRLRQLDLTGSNIDGAALTNLARLPLELITLDELQPISGTDLSSLRSIRTLKRLTINNTVLPDSALRSLNPYLRELQVNSDNQLTHKGLLNLAKLSNLRRLTLIGDNMLDKDSIGALRKLNRLEYLAIQSTKLSDRDVDKLRQLMPQCLIDYSQETPSVAPQSDQ